MTSTPAMNGKPGMQRKPISDISLSLSLFFSFLAIALRFLFLFQLPLLSCILRVVFTSMSCSFALMLRLPLSLPPSFYHLRGLYSFILSSTFPLDGRSRS